MSPVLSINFRATILNHVQGHQGVSRSQVLVWLTLYWPGIDNDIESFVHGSCHCQDHLQFQGKEPLISNPLPERPFQHIAVDIGSYTGRQYLIVVDCKTDWPDVIYMGNDITASHLIESLRDQFSHTAVPDLLWSDGVPQFTLSKFTSFLTRWGIAHKVSLSQYPQSNVKVEATVKSMKKFISSALTDNSVDREKLYCSLLQYRNTPCHKDGISPAQKLLGHPIQNHLPAHRHSFHRSGKGHQKNRIRCVSNPKNRQSESTTYINV